MAETSKTPPVEEQPAETPPVEETKEPTRKKGHIVTAAAAVLSTEDGSERYLYKGALVLDGFTKESIKHALDVGLITKEK